MGVSDTGCRYKAHPQAAADNLFSMDSILLFLSSPWRLTHVISIVSVVVVVVVVVGVVGVVVVVVVVL